MVKRTREERRRFLTKAHAAIAAGLLTPAHESDDDEDVPSPAEVRVRERRGFVRERPRFRERQGHARWYGEWGTGFWHQFVDRENVENHPLLREEFEQRFRVPHALFCELEDEMTTAGVFRQRTKSKSVLPRLLLLASLRRLASGTHWSVISECVFVSQRALRRFFDGTFVPYFSSDAYYLVSG